LKGRQHGQAFGGAAWSTRAPVIEALRVAIRAG
jgi:hypothetical protein